MPIFLRGIYKIENLTRDLRRYGLRKKDIQKFYFANGGVLLFLKNEKLCKEFYKDLIPNDDFVKEVIEVHNYVEKFKKLINLEREAEIKTQQEEIKKLSGKERELLGRAILDLKGVKAGSKFHFHLVKFGRKKPIETEIAVGDVVLISQGNPLKSNLTGTVVKITEKTIIVAFENKPPKWVYKKGVRMDLYINDITFKRMEENLEIFRHAEGRQRELRNILLGLKKPSLAKEVDFEVFDKRLNFKQIIAIKKALGSKDFYLFHGPPGTGKTSTITELIYQLVKRGFKVLATADSNIAVDNIILGLLRYPSLKIVRIGHPARVMEELENYSIYALLENHPATTEIKTGWKKLRGLIEKRERCLKPSPSFRRGLKDEEILFLAERNKGARGVSKNLIKSMAKWIILNREIEERIRALKDKETAIIREIILTADVVVSTNSMVQSDFLKNFCFDVAVIDEGSQQVEPSTLIPITKVDRFYIAGDHKQLPPTVVSEKAKELENTLFERLIKNHPELSTMLEVQYRMNEKIMEFPNKMFYDGKLIAGESVKNHLLKDFNLKKPEKYVEVLNPEKPLGFIDTCETNAYEFQPSGSTSYENYREAVLVVEVVSELLKMGLNKKDIGVITPYSAQVKLIKQLFLEKNIKVEVNSIDGFQGREKEVIIISFVRSNEEEEIGFLKDLRRLNVAITRARRKLIIIGNSKTLSSHPVYRKFLEFVKPRLVL